MVEYRKGKENKATDALSMRMEDGVAMAISHPTPTWLDTVHEEYNSILELQKLIDQFEKGELDLTRFTRHNGIIFYRGKIYILCFSFPKFHFETTPQESNGKTLKVSKDFEMGPGRFFLAWSSHLCSQLHSRMRHLPTNEERKHRTHRTAPTIAYFGNELD